MAESVQSPNLSRRKALTVERLREVLSYDPNTGIFRWLVSVGRVKAGAEAGCRRDNYILIRIDGETYRAHRLAVLWMNGSWPKNQVDHKDRDRGNNRWANLREATRAQNNANSPAHFDNRSGLKGVTWHAGAKKWMAQIQRDRHLRYLGLFETPEEAHAAYVAEAKVLFGEFASAG